MATATAFFTVFEAVFREIFRGAARFDTVFFLVEVFRAVLRLAVVFFNADLRDEDRLTADFLTAVFLAEAFLTVDLRTDVFCPALREAGRLRLEAGEALRADEARATEVAMDS